MSNTKLAIKVLAAVLIIAVTSPSFVAGVLFEAFADAFAWGRAEFSNFVDRFFC